MSYIDELAAEAAEAIRANDVPENERERWMSPGILKIQKEPDKRFRESAIRAFREKVAELLSV